MKHLVPLLLLCAAPLTAQPLMSFRFDPSVRDSLATWWRRDVANANATEHGYCLTYETHDRPFGVREYRMISVRPADGEMLATPYSVTYQCGPDELDVHTHTASTCPLVGAFDHDNQHCAHGGEDAYLCFPSWQDGASEAKQHRAFGFVQCDEHALVPYRALHPVGT